MRKYIQLQLQLEFLLQAHPHYFYSNIHQAHSLSQIENLRQTILPFQRMITQKFDLKQRLLNFEKTPFRRSKVTTCHFWVKSSPIALNIFFKKNH